MKLFTLALTTVSAVAAKVSYDGWTVYHVETHGDYENIARELSGLEMVQLDCEDNHDSLNVAIAPDSAGAFESLELDATISVTDLGADIAREGSMTRYYPTAKPRFSRRATLPDLAYFESYHEIEDHFTFLEDLHAAFPSNSEVYSAGDSLEGRPLQGIHLWGEGGPGKEAIIWHGTVHAREWIAAPTAEYVTYKLIEGFQNNDTIAVNALNKFDFFIIPIVNPDGFVYTYETERLWRKNRQAREGATCVGTDINRNWPNRWDVEGGSSPDPCSQTYRGEAPGDTPENAVLTNHSLSIAESVGIKWYVDWHSFGQLVLFPYGYDCEILADNHDQQSSFAQGYADAVQAVNGSVFTPGTTCVTLYQTSGACMDWHHEIAGSELSWLIELRPNDSSLGGFVIPPENILPSGKDQWAGVRYMLENL